MKTSESTGSGITSALPPPAGGARGYVHARLLFSGCTCTLSSGRRSNDCLYDCALAISKYFVCNSLPYQTTECPAPSATLSTVNSAYMRRLTAPLVWHLLAPRPSDPGYRAALPLPLRLLMSLLALQARLRLPARCAARWAAVVLTKPRQRRSGTAPAAPIAQRLQGPACLQCLLTGPHRHLLGLPHAANPCCLPTWADRPAPHLRAQRPPAQCQRCRPPQCSPLQPQTPPNAHQAECLPSLSLRCRQPTHPPVRPARLLPTADSSGHGVGIIPAQSMMDIDSFR